MARAWCRDPCGHGAPPSAAHCCPPARQHFPLHRCLLASISDGLAALLCSSRAEYCWEGVRPCTVPAMLGLPQSSIAICSA